MAIESPEERQRRIREAMAASLQPVADRSGIGGMLEPPREPVPAKPIINLPPANVSTAGLAPPVAESPFPVSVQPSSPNVGPPPPRVGYSLAGLTGVDRLMEKRKAYESADPESRIREVGDLVKVEDHAPRKGFKGKLKSIGEGLLTGLEMADPDNPNNILGSAIGGGGLGAASNRGEAKLKRRFDLSRLDNDISRGLKLEQEQAQLGGMKALMAQRELEPLQQAAKLDQEREIANARLEIERQKAQGLITQQQAMIAQRELDRKSREQTNAASNEARIKAAEITAGARGQETPAAAEKRGREEAAAQAEYDQLLSDEQKAGEEKNRAYEYLKKIKAAAVRDFSGELDEASKSDIAEATRAAEEANKIYQSFAEKKRAAQTRIKENTGTPQKSLDPELEKKIRAAASAKNLDPDEAVRRAIARL